MAHASRFPQSFRNGGMLDLENLRLHLRVGLRRRTWASLDTVDKALYRCAMWVAKARGRITNPKLLARILDIISKLVATPGTRIYTLGLARARALRNRYISAGVFEWAPEVATMFSRREYIMYLGVMELHS